MYKERFAVIDNKIYHYGVEVAELTTLNASVRQSFLDEMAYDSTLTDELSGQIDELYRTIEDKDREIYDLSSEVTSLEFKVEDLEEEIRRKDTEIGDLDALIFDLESQINVLKWSYEE